MLGLHFSHLNIGLFLGKIVILICVTAYEEICHAPLNLGSFSLKASNDTVPDAAEVLLADESIAIVV